MHGAGYLPRPRIPHGRVGIVRPRIKFDALPTIEQQEEPTSDDSGNGGNGGAPVVVVHAEVHSVPAPDAAHSVPEAAAGVDLAEEEVPEVVLHLGDGGVAAQGESRPRYVEIVCELLISLYTFSGTSDYVTFQSVKRGSE